MNLLLANFELICFSNVKTDLPRVVGPVSGLRFFLSGEIEHRSRNLRLAYAWKPD